MPPVAYFRFRTQRRNPRVWQLAMKQQPRTPASQTRPKPKRRNAIGSRVVWAREYRRWRQKDLLNELATHGWVLSQSDLSKLERGEREVTDFELYCLASVLGASLGFFFRDAHGRMIQRLLKTSARRAPRKRPAAESAPPPSASPRPLELPVPDPLQRSKSMLQ